MSGTTQEITKIKQNLHTQQEWQKKFFAMGCQCHYCQKPLTLKEASKDHRTPKCRGGSDRIWNIVPACLPCNMQKGWRTEAEFFKYRAGFSAEAQARLAKEKPNPLEMPTHHYEDFIEPGLLKTLTAERERGFWWRQP